MDYSVEVVGDMVAGAASHDCFDHTPFGGIVIPTLAGRSAALRRVQCYRVRRAYYYK